MSVQVQLRRGTAAQWNLANPILAQGEMAVELDTHQFKIGNGIDTWSDLPYGGIGGGGDAYKIQMITLDSTMITNKQLTLSNANLSPSETLVFVDGGPVQKYGVDFTVLSDVLSWTGLGMETIIGVGDILIIQYKY